MEGTTVHGNRPWPFGPQRARRREERTMSNSDCIFCRIVEGKLPGKILHSDEEVVAFRDLNPRAPTHVLIVPRKHIPGSNDVTAADAGCLGRLHLVARDVAKKEGVAESGYRLVVNTGSRAGQSVFHFHMHLLGGRPMGWPPG